MLPTLTSAFESLESTFGQETAYGIQFYFMKICMAPTARNPGRNEKTPVNVKIGIYLTSDAESRVSEQPTVVHSLKRTTQTCQFVPSQKKTRSLSTLRLGILIVYICYKWWNYPNKKTNKQTNKQKISNIFVYELAIRFLHRITHPLGQSICFVLVWICISHLVIGTDP